MVRRDLILIGASAGGVEALRSIVERLPADLPAAILVVVHVPAEATSLLPTILQRAGKLAASHAVDGEPILPGRIYVAPPDLHLLVHGSELRLSRGPRINHHRPAVDALFLSAAGWAAQRAIAVVLSGGLDDGTHGAFAVRREGGVVIAQSPDDAMHPSMPLHAIEQAGVDHIASAREIPSLLVALTSADADADAGSAPARGVAYCMLGERAALAKPGYLRKMPELAAKCQTQYEEALQQAETIRGGLDRVSGASRRGR